MQEVMLSCAHLCFPSTAPALAVQQPPETGTPAPLNMLQTAVRLPGEGLCPYSKDLMALCQACMRLADCVCCTLQYILGI